jgi:hypothetical protein
MPETLGKLPGFSQFCYQVAKRPHFKLRSPGAEGELSAIRVRADACQAHAADAGAADLAGRNVDSPKFEASCRRAATRENPRGRR